MSFFYEIYKSNNLLLSETLNWKMQIELTEKLKVSSKLKFIHRHVSLFVSCKHALPLVQFYN